MYELDVDKLFYGKRKFFEVYQKLLGHSPDIYQVYFFFKLLFMGFFAKVSSHPPKNPFCLFFKNCTKKAKIRVIEPK